MSEQREVREGTQFQGIDEEVFYRLNTQPWGGTPTNPVIVIKEMPLGTDVTVAKTTGAATISGDVIVLPKIRLLEAGKRYRVEVKFTSGGNLLEAVFYIRGET